MIYQNFDLEIITPREGQLCARVLESPQGDCPFVNVKWPFEAQEENELLSEIYGGLRQRRARSNKGGTIQDFGGKLFEAVFSGDIEHLFRSSLDTAARAGQGLRIRLRLPEDSELHARPWEFLFDTESREFLAVREHTPLIRYLPVAQPIPPITVEGPLRVLVALSSPTDHPRLDIAREWEILCQALEPSISAGRLELRRVPGCCTFDNLRDSLRHFSTHIFHFVGHGLPGALVLEQESGRGQEMEATHLRSAFPGGALPRLIVLNACSGAISEDVPFSGLAQGFLRQGVPAVVAMQASITDDAALIFTRYFYRDLVETGAVDASLTEARLRMQGNGHPIEWGTPVLYMRALSGQLFQPSALPVAKEPPPKIIIDPPLQPEPSPTVKKRPRTGRSREHPPPEAEPPPQTEPPPRTVPPKAPKEHTAPPRLEPELVEKKLPPKAPPPKEQSPPPKPEPRPEAQHTPPKAAPKEPMPPPAPAPRPAEQAVPPKTAAKKHPPPPPRQEPSLDERDIPSSAQATEPLPVSRPAPAPMPKATPPRQAKAAYTRWLLIYAVAGAVLAAVLAIAIGVDKTSPSRKITPARATPAAPTLANKPAPVPGSAPAAPERQAPAAVSSPGEHLTQVPGAQAKAPEPSPRAPAPAARKTQPKTKAARPARTDNCKNPDVSQRDASCLFQRP